MTALCQFVTSDRAVLHAVTRNQTPLRNQSHSNTIACHCGRMLTQG